MKTLLSLLVVLLALSGCASTEFKAAQAAHFEGQAALDKAEARLVDTPLLDLQMGEDGKLKSLKVGRQSTGRVATAAPVDANAALVRDVVSGVVTVGSIVAGGKAAANLVNAVGGVVGKVAAPSNTTTTTITPTTTTTNTSSVANTATTTTTNTANNTTTTNTSTDNHSANATATPTVVTQPVPLVVTQPAPLVVTQPEPTVVGTPPLTVLH